MTVAWSKPIRSPITRSAPRPTLRLDVFTQRNTRVVHVTGELDLTSHDQLVATSTAGHHPAVMIDLGGVSFMDCSGYGALVASRTVIEGEGRSLAITGQTGQPARLWKLIADLEHGHRTRPEPMAGVAAVPQV